MDFKFVLVLVFSLFVAIFTIQNAEPVDIQFLGFEFSQVSQALVILISAVAGALIVLLFSAIRWVKDKSKIVGAKKSIAALEAQVKQLQIKLEAETAKAAPPTTPVKTAAPIPVSDPSVDSQATVAEPESTEPKAEEPAPKRKWYQI